MGIQWFNAKERVGQASFYNNNITLNTIASVPFESAYRVQVGIDENKQVVIEPLSKERVERGDLDEYNLLEIQFRKNYSRICSTALLNKIGGVLGIVFSKDAIRYETEWDDKSNLLVIHMTQEGRPHERH
jgi:hypothetical protein